MKMKQHYSPTNAVDLSCNSDPPDDSNGQKGNDTQNDQNADNGNTDSSTRNPTGGTSESHNQEALSVRSDIKMIDILDFWQRTNQNPPLCDHYNIGNLKDRKPCIIIEKNYFDNISSIKCDICKVTTQIDPWWMFDKCTEVKEEIFRFLRYHNPTK